MFLVLFLSKILFPRTVLIPKIGRGMVVVDLMAEQNSQPTPTPQLQNQSKNNVSIMAKSLVFFCALCFVLAPTVAELSLGTTTNSDNTRTVFLAIGSAPKQSHLRNTIRQTWLKDCVKDPYCDYRFFTDAPAGNNTCVNDFCEPDMILTDRAFKGYTNFGTRGHIQLNHSLRHFDFDYYLRIDDDGLLCHQHLRSIIPQLPLKRVIWGRYVFVLSVHLC